MGKASDTFASITRDEWAEWKEKYLPGMKELQSEIGRSRYAEDAAQYSDENSALAKGVEERNISRFGVNLSAAQRRSMSRRTAIGNASTKADAVNNARVAEVERDYAIGAEILNLSRENTSQSMQGLGFAAQAEKNREMYNRQAKQQQKQSQLGGAMSGAMMGAMVGGPMGAAIGGIAGFALG
ncbi:hypothetical protein [Motiliproteus coralliicola]|nr:hypothetical protein [Motiliproteus coralliicola]